GSTAATVGFGAISAGRLKRFGAVCISPGGKQQCSDRRHGGRDVIGIACGLREFKCCACLRRDWCAIKDANNFGASDTGKSQLRGDPAGVRLKHRS
ncbi:hypothetical protein, partial [Burkholderia sp. Nafp2/4-1b]|uniref:hypothetical protein n=1 Tax=Burkholderia sp. Nafp2/4-1b TaxID=2116686 RepID=UPI001969C322